MRLISSIILFVALSNPFLALAQSEKVFKTKYSTVYYVADKDLSDFIWRIGGTRFEFSTDTNLAQNRIDRIIERVETILDMWPKNFNIDVYLHKEELQLNKVAYYEHKTKSIHASIDNVSDGVFAHEIAHAVISQYFSSPPPSKAQEILTQYVDKYLWSDY
ncbi:MAG: hypothetical protein Q8O30_03915 [Candidatus Omnitrophota bacterium]|nr:hypothetical protein [Candidatus Omnitrophota bacterium]